MQKRLLIISVLVMALVVGMSGCSVGFGENTATTAPNPKIVNQAILAGKWQMYQLKVDIGSGTKLPIQMDLVYGDEVDGYYYVETPATRVDFYITGNTQIYQSAAPTDGEASSDRFTLTAIQSQGHSYMLTWENPATNKKDVSVFIELIYPVTGNIFKPLEAK